MSHIADLQTLESGSLAVGWLHPDHPFSQADPTSAFLAKLKEYANRSGASAVALGMGAAGGYHTCEFCQRAHGTANFAVPAGDKMYFSPEMIAHYVETHRYAPPPEYVAAVMDSPLPGTREYVTAVAPFVARERALTMKDPVAVTLERHVALVLFAPARYRLPAAASASANPYSTPLADIIATRLISRQEAGFKCSKID